MEICNILVLRDTIYLRVIIRKNAYEVYNKRNKL